MDRIRAYLTGVTPTVPSESAPEVAQPMASILEAVHSRHDDELLVAELGRIIGRIPTDETPEAQRAAAIRLGRELGAAPWFLKAERKNTGSVIQLGELRRAAAEVTAGTRRAPLN